MANLCVTNTVEAPSATWSCNRVTANESGVLAIGSSLQLRKVTIVNDPEGVGITARVYLVPSPATPVSSGFLLLPGAGMEIDTRAAVYVKCQPGETAIVYILAESGY